MEEDIEREIWWSVTWINNKGQQFTDEVVASGPEEAALLVHKLNVEFFSLIDIKAII